MIITLCSIVNPHSCRTSADWSAGCFFVYSGKKQAKQEDLKEMGDISSGMSSSIMQIYLKQVLDSFFHSQSTVRHFALSVITLTLNQGLIHPVQVCSQLTHKIFCNHMMTLLSWMHHKTCFCGFFSVCPTWLPWEQTLSQPWRTRLINSWWRLTRNILASSMWVIYDQQKKFN